jgi:hypothetical protein
MILKVISHQLLKMKNEINFKIKIRLILSVKIIKKIKKMIT